MKHKWPMIGPFTSLDSDLMQLFESHGIDITTYDVQPRHSDSGATALWTIEGRHLNPQEQREDVREEDGQQFAVITFPVDSFEEFEREREASKLEDETWFFANSQRDVVSELDSPIQKLEKLASKDQKQSAEEAAEIVKETLQELQAIRKRNQLHQIKNTGSKSSNDISGEELLDDAGNEEEPGR